MTLSNRHADMANAIRALSMDAVQKANSGHPGLPMGAADIATVLFTKFMKFDPTQPHWPDRDRFVLSAGHGSMLLYSLLHLLGYEDMTIDEIKNFRQLGAKTAGHPEFGYAAGIETTTGPLGQGIANAVGMALAERVLNSEFSDDLVDHKTYCLVGDGCLMEGISQEAIALAGHLKLNKLIVLWDDNDITIDGPVSISDSTDQAIRFQASGWNTLSCDGHNPAAIEAAITEAQSSDKPTMIACKTQIGFGSPNKAGTSKVHGSPLGDDEIAATREALGWEHEPFHIPTDIYDAWRIAALNAAKPRHEWDERLEAADAEKRGEFLRRMEGRLPSGFERAMDEYRQQLAVDKPKVATRKSSEMALEIINAAVPETLGGSADLTGSNNTKTTGMTTISADDFTGRYVGYGIREHGMAAAMNGIALHGGLIPYGGTFFAFTDYCRPAIRLSALMHQRVVYVMTHDSIGLGEDGPTHQPVEHMTAMRCMPGLLTLRPGDAMETAECWQIALERKDGPTVLALTRQGLAAFRTEHDEKNHCAKGAYTVTNTSLEEQVTLFASGSEVNIALDAKAKLEEDGIGTRVVSVPSFELFRSQSDEYRASIIGSAPARVAVEAGVEMGWNLFLGESGKFVGMDGFGASAPITDLYAHFGITADAVADAAKAQLG
ncbi:MAG: transketolase [Pseudomonadota bacterium]